MNVLPCSPCVASSAHDWANICKEEGVYQPIGTPEVSLIVLKADGVTFILYLRNGVLQPAADSWKGYGYIKLDKSVYMEVR